MRHLHVEPDEAERVADRWRAELGWTVCLLTRDEAIDGGLFGPVVRPEVRGRIGDLLVLAVGPVAFFDSRVAPGEIALTGHHGSLTGAELFVPALEFVR
ncbi:MAG: hypothetical protein H0W07_03845 [Chloroflexi bacterium]|nr:hypothetical protein [Chloroflexota bacterium]